MNLHLKKYSVNENEIIYSFIADSGRYKGIANLFTHSEQVVICLESTADFEFEYYRRKITAYLLRYWKESENLIENLPQEKYYAWG